LARKKSENHSREGEKRARLVGKRMDALSLCSDTLMLTKHFFCFFFFCRGTTFSLKTPLSSPQKSKTHQQPLLEITKKIMGVLRVKGTHVTHVTLARGRCFRSRNALDRTVLVRRRGTFFIAISNAETFLRMNSIKSLSLSLFCFSKNIFLCRSRF